MLIEACLFECRTPSFDKHCTPPGVPGPRPVADPTTRLIDLSKILDLREERE
jgi:hypothetical protein